MAVIRDVMPAFELFQPTSIADAQKLLQQQGHDAWCSPEAWIASTGSRTASKAKMVVDLSGITELKGVRTAADGIEMGR